MDVPPPPAPGADVITAAPLTPQASGPSAPVAPAAPASAPASQGQEHAGLAPAVAKIFSGGGIPVPQSLDVSYRVVKNPNEIVTVFTDPRTGQEIAQFPPELMIGLAEFFDQQQGATLDRSA
ncbi:MAG: hypothetical protein ACYDGM_05465 [Vulcanimicrobiaceae bacterium]